METPDTDADFIAIDAALAEAFGNEFPPSPEGAARLRRIQNHGRRGAVRAREPTAAARAAACARRPRWAPRNWPGSAPGRNTGDEGVAAGVVASLTEAMFARGNTSVWLEYGGDGSRRVYERIGYRRGGRRLYVSIPD